MRHVLEMPRDALVIVVTVLGLLAAFAAAVPVWVAREFQAANRRQRVWRQLQAEPESERAGEAKTRP